MEISIISRAEFGDDFEARYEGARNNNKIVIVSHRDSSLEWNITNKTWNSNDIEATNSIFDPINRYMQSLPMDRQDKIFEVYKQIRKVLSDVKTQVVENNEGVKNLIEATQPLATELFSLIDQNHFHNWVWSVLRPNVPANIRDEFDPSTMPGTRERTYLRPDYHELIPLAIIVRMACPFWLDFIFLTKTTLNKEFKDMHVYSIIQNSWPSKSAAMARLREFVTHTVGNDNKNPAAVLMGIGSDIFIDWVLTHVVVTKLPVVEVMGNNLTAPVAPALFSAIRARVATVTNTQPKIKKKFADTSSNDENNQSYLEGFRSRMAITVGQELTGTSYVLKTIKRLRRLRNSKTGLIERVAPDIDLRLVRECMKSCKILLDVELVNQQVNLAAWLFHPYNQVRTIGNLRKTELVSLIAMAQAVLLHQGKIDLAILVSAIYKPNGLDSDTVIGETIAPIRAPERAAYGRNFPIEQRTRGGGRTPTNTVVEDVQVMVRMLQSFDITCTFSETLSEKYRPNATNPRYALAKNASFMFMDFVSELAEREIVELDPMEVYNSKYGAQQTKPY